MKREYPEAAASQTLSRRMVDQGGLRVTGRLFDDLAKLMNTDRFHCARQRFLPTGSRTQVSIAAKWTRSLASGCLAVATGLKLRLNASRCRQSRKSVDPAPGRIEQVMDWWGQEPAPAAREIRFKQACEE
jgi:hypothetical protein